MDTTYYIERKNEDGTWSGVTHVAEQKTHSKCFSEATWKSQEKMQRWADELAMDYGWETRVKHTGPDNSVTVSDNG